MFNIGTKIVVKNARERSGVVQGYGTMKAQATDRIDAVYIIFLDNGFYSADGDSYVSVVIAHPDNVEEVV